MNFLATRGVETRMVLLGHTNKQITTHYSAVEIGELIEAVERVTFERGSTPTLTLPKSPTATTEGGSRKSHAGTSGALVTSSVLFA